MKVFTNVPSKAIIVIDNQIAVIEPYPTAGTQKDQLKNAQRRLSGNGTGIFHFHEALTEIIDPPKEQKPEDFPEDQHNPG